MGLSPGVHSVKYANKCMKRRQLRQAKANLAATKRRRLVLKQERMVNQGALETLEGVSYQSGIGHEANPDVDKLPDPVPRGNFQATKLQSGEPTIISFDLETTDLFRGGVMPHITQIAAAYTKAGEKLDIYVRPEVPISIEAQRVTGITMCADTMSVNGTVVESIPIKAALMKLCSWLEHFSNVCLVAHNGRRFDFPVLMHTFMQTGLKERVFKCVTGCIDSLPIFRKMYPKQSHKQIYLVKSLLGVTYEAHNAMADVMSLSQLLSFVNLCHKGILLYSFSPLAVQNNILFNHQKSVNMKTLELLIYKGICKRPTAENIAGSGLNLHHLKTMYKRSGEDGLHNVFTVKNNDGLPRVTNVKKVLDDVIPKLGHFFSTQ